MMNLVSEEEALGFWSEHSERVTMSSWAAALGIKQEVIKRWGRWRPSEYVKTTKVLVSQAQRNVAEVLKETGMIKDLLGEDEVMEALKKRLKERSVPDDRVRNQIKRLRFQWEAYRMEQEGCMSARGRRIQESPTEIVPVPEAVDLEDLELSSDETRTSYGMGTYILSVVRRSKRRTLHVIGGCYRVPGVDYRDFVVVGDVRPQLAGRGCVQFASTPERRQL